MAALTIPTRFDGTARYSIEVQLEDVSYVLRFSWLSRSEMWFMDILSSLTDDDGLNVPIVTGIALTTGTPLLSGYVSSNLPPGEFMVVDSTSSTLDPGLTELGEDQRCELIYMESADLPDGVR